MDPIIEISFKNILFDKKINSDDKSQFMLIINRISTFEITKEQLHRQNAYHILFNALNEEILFLEEQKKFSNNKLSGNIKIFFNDFLSYQIDKHKKYLKEMNL
jgi:hypothetical protein